MLNQVQLIGHLGRDPETRYTTGGDAVTNLNVATSERWKDKSGEKQERTEWHRVVMFGKLAEVAGEWLKKGALVFIQGKLQTRKWTDRDGAEKYTTEIVANDMKMLGGKREEGETARTTSGGQDYKDAKDGTAKTSGAKRGGAHGDFDDDIPF